MQEQRGHPGFGGAELLNVCCQVLHTVEVLLRRGSEPPSGQFDKGNRVGKGFNQCVEDIRHMLGVAHLFSALRPERNGSWAPSYKRTARIKMSLGSWSLHGS